MVRCDFSSRCLAHVATFFARFLLSVFLSAPPFDLLAATAVFKQPRVLKARLKADRRRLRLILPAALRFCKQRRGGSFWAMHYTGAPPIAIREKCMLPPGFSGAQ